MPRRHRDDDDRPIRRKNVFPLWALVLSIVAPVLLLCVGGGIGTVWLFGQAKEASERDAESRRINEKVYTRDEFRAMLLGKKKGEVIALVGRPYETKEPGSGNYWIYQNRTYDPISRRNDFLSWVRFDDDDFVDEVDF